MSIPCYCRGGEEEDGLPGYETSPDLALVALLTLMSSFPARRSAAVAQSIVTHLRVVSADERLDGILRGCAAQLVSNWEALTVLSQPGPEPLAPSTRVVN
ncbi:hypothetical protein [Zoogloea sp. LCSB751]|uniref:hypothetical protein n=1 Tax=Zoogloea sp. LCSB751 TaxID=1965277 RepID=UPI0009A4B911|nr:hypothetical protein [Zoogloea sp. LCSB751]MBS0369843.1 hypothetical protein [Pseudomonadota bacterium]